MTISRSAHLLAVVALCGLFHSTARAAEPKTTDKVDFARDVRTILAGRCFACHGPDETARKAGFRLDLREQATAPRKKTGRTPIVPGDVKASALVERIFSEDPDELMPPPEVKKPLTEAEKQTLKKWVEQGAEYELHWSFNPAKRPALPKVKNAAWGENEIDRFVLATLEANALKPSPRADRYTLVRRLYLDLLGFSPTPAQADEFVHDPRPDAWERLVDRVLDDPRFGEKIGLMWLDLARFGDTNGYHYDSTREMWLWRDYVTNAYNHDMPYDRFTVEQLAGDMLDQPTTEQLIASGFNRNTRFNEEGGADPEEFAITYAKDRVFTLGQVWLGLTTGCAECHSHKYDPISQKEYYQLFAFFNSIKEPMASGNHGQKLEPVLKVPMEGQTQALEEARARHAALEAQIAAELAKVTYQEPAAPAPDAAAPADAHLRSLAAWEKVAAEDKKVPQNIRDAIKVETAKRTPEQTKLLTDHYVRHVFADTRALFDPLNKQEAHWRLTVDQREKAIPTTMVSQELDKTRDAFLLVRGDFLQRGEKVEREVPAVFPPMDRDLPRNRLGLAKWLVDPEHPLIARVAVNRLWHQMFGTGIVKTLGDFGAQGELPSHAALLDWLATEYIRNGWSTKSLLRTIAMSATYQQSSSLKGNIAGKDPYNRLLYRAPRFRIAAEEVRDGALQIAELLSTKIGGPSVMPYQPEGFYVGKNENWPWKLADGEELYRRGMYTFWRRTSLHPMFAIFDAPSREVCTVERPRTNTPLQALTTLNGPMFIEAARVLAQNVMLETPADQSLRLRELFRRIMVRPPTAAEAALIGQMYQQQHELFKADPSAAQQLVQAGRYRQAAGLDPVELAAWTAVANALMNTDEAITRE